jgi:ankyrin repeat protein
MHNVPPIARLLLAHGANPNDGESVFHAAERFHADALELLLEAGADLNYTGEWGNTPLYFLLHWHDVEREPRVRQGLDWLLAHGADPNVRCGRERETSLHVAARRGQAPAVIRRLLDHGADVRAHRGDGRGAWALAMRGGFDEVVAVLEAAGTPRESLSPVDTLLSACGRGDAEAARRLASPALVDALEPDDRRLLPEAAAAGRVDTVLACLVAGLPVDTVDISGASALHHAAIQGRAPLVRALLAAGADVTLRDQEHRSTPLGWAFFGADYFLESDGDYADCVRALLDAGARPRDDEHKPGHAGVRAVLRRHHA